jgi:hypothetical protein
MGIAENTICRWKSRYGEMEVPEAKRLRQLEQESARLKRLLAEVAATLRPRQATSIIGKKLPAVLAGKAA